MVRMFRCQSRRTKDSKVFVEAIDCQSIRKGSGWIIRFLKEADVRMIVTDGKSGQELLMEECHDNKIRPVPQSIRVDIQRTIFYTRDTLTVTNCRRLGRKITIFSGQS